jgi:hypothetical protein
MTKQETHAILAQEHKQWLHLTITKGLTTALDKHENFIADKIAMFAMDKDTTPEHVRLLAAQLATVKTIKKLIYDTETYIAKCSVN